VIIHCGSAVGSSQAEGQPDRITETDATGLACAKQCQPGGAKACGYSSMVNGDTTCVVFAKGVGGIVSEDPGWVVFEQVKTTVCSS